MKEEEEEEEEEGEKGGREGEEDEGDEGGLRRSGSVDPPLFLRSLSSRNCAALLARAARTLTVLTSHHDTDFGPGLAPARRKALFRRAGATTTILSTSMSPGGATIGGGAEVGGRGGAPAASRAEPGDDVPDLRPTWEFSGKTCSSPSGGRPKAWDVSRGGGGTPLGGEADG